MKHDPLSGLGWLERLLWRHRPAEHQEEIRERRATRKRRSKRRAVKAAHRKNRKPKAHKPRNKRR